MRGTARHTIDHVRGQECVDVHCRRASAHSTGYMPVNHGRRTLSDEEIEEKDVERLGRGKVLLCHTCS